MLKLKGSYNKIMNPTPSQTSPVSVLGIETFKN